jgi:hypothetical protein
MSSSAAWVDSASPAAGRDREERFNALQARLVALGPDPLDAPHTTIVALPSLEVDRHVLSRHVDVLSACEERALYQAFLLQRPDVRMLFVTSEPVEEATLLGYLKLLPGGDPVEARGRIEVVSPDDRSPRPLAEKLLERPAVLERIRALAGERARAFIAPYAVTDTEREVALRLDVPLYGSPPRLAVYGTKSGARRLFAQEDVAHPIGAEQLRHVDALVEAILEIRARRPTAHAVVIKLDEGIYGESNRIVSLAGLTHGAGRRARTEVRRRVEVLGEQYLAEVAAGSAVVEQLITGRMLRSPSVQMRILPDGSLCEFSTHEQLLGGETGQTFVGCRFPASHEYASDLVELGARVGVRLAREGAMGRVGIDFVTARGRDGSWCAYAIEINLRDGGTTHPFGTLRLLTGGVYDHRRGEFTIPSGDRRHYRASDDLEDPAWAGTSIDQLTEAAARQRLLYDPALKLGAVFHMGRSLAREGRIGVTAIGASRRHADRIYAGVVGLLNELGRRQRTAPSLAMPRLTLAQSGAAQARVRGAS